MPKIIENLEQRLIQEAKRQIETAGYGAMTIRSVAKACGVGVGTVYNYFPSKDALVAAYMLPGWQECMAAIQKTSQEADTPLPVVQCIYGQLQHYSRLHQGLFADEAASTSFAGAFTRYHALLRSQLAQPLRKFCASDFASEFIAESLLTWTVAGKSFQEIYGIIEKLF